MGFKEDACEYVTGTAREIWEKRQDKRDGYVPRSLELYSDDRQNDNPLFTRTYFEDKSLIEQDRIAIIGSSASGKSYLIDHIYGESLNRFEEREGDAPFPIHIDCGSGLPSSNSITDAIRYKFGSLFERISSEHDPGIHLFLDEIDTRLRHDSSFRFDLIESLQEIEDEVGNLRLMLTSRKREWERLFEFRQKVEARKIRVLEFPSRPSPEAYEHLIPDDEHREAFFEACYQRGFSVLLDLPMEGFELARTYEETGELPESRYQLMDRHIDERLVKSDSEEVLISAPPRRRLRYLAGLLACISFFSERESWSVRDAINDLGETALVGEIQPVTSAEVKWLIQSRLFHSIDKEQYVFAHNSFRETLAAETIAQLKPRKQRCLLRAGRVRGRERVIPAVRSVAVSLATLDSRYYDYLKSAEPELAVFSAAPRLSREERRDVIEQFAEWGNRGHHPPWIELQGIGEPAYIALERHKNILTPDFVLRYLNSDIPMERLWGVVMARYTEIVPSVGERLLSIAHDAQEATRARKRALEAFETEADGSYAGRIEPLLQDEDDEVRGYALAAWRILRNPSPTEYIQQLNKPRSKSSLYGRLFRDPQRYTRKLTSEQATEAFQALERQYEIATAQSPSPDILTSGFNDLQRNLLRGLIERTSKLDDVQVSTELLVSFLSGYSSHPTDSTAVVETLRVHPRLWDEVLAECLSRAGDYRFDLSTILAKSAPDDYESRIFLLGDVGGRRAGFLERLTSEIERLNSEQNSATYNVEPLFGSAQEGWVPPEQPILSDEEPLPAHVDQAEVNKRIQAVVDGYTDVQARARALVAEFWRISVGRETSVPVSPLSVTSLKPSSLSQLIDLLQSNLQSEVLEALRDGLSELASESVARPVVLCLVERGESVQAETVSDVLIHSELWRDDSRSNLEIQLLKHLREFDREVWEDTVDYLMANRPGARFRVLQHLIDTEDGFYVQEVEHKLRAADFTNRSEWRRMVEYVKAHIEDGLTDILVAAFLAAETKVDLLKDDRATENAPQGTVSQSDLLGLLVDIADNGDERGWVLLDDRLSSGAIPLKDELLEVRIPTPTTPSHVAILSRWYRQVRLANDELASEAPARSRDSYGSVARALMDQIVTHASKAAVDAVSSLQQSDEFVGAMWLSSRYLDVVDEYLIHQTTFYSIRELLEFILTDLFHLIRSEGDLFDVLLQVLEDLQRDFGEGRGVAGFWNPLSKNDEDYSAPASSNLTCVEKPKDETDCQNVLWGLVRPRLRAYGVTDVEEDFVGKNRADLKLDYVEAGKRSVRVFLELKVAHKEYTFGRGTNNDLFDPIEDQLWGKYLHPTGVKHGVYAVIWPKDPERYAWPRYTRRPYSKRYESPEAFQRALSERAEAVNREHGVSIETVVLDITKEYR